MEDENLRLTPKCMSRSMLARTSRDVPSQMHVSELLVLMHRLYGNLDAHWYTRQLQVARTQVRDGERAGVSIHAYACT